MMYTYTIPKRYTTRSPARLAKRVLPKEKSPLLSEIQPVSHAPAMNPMRYPNVGWKIYEGPPPSVKTGTPASPRSTYSPTEQAPFRLPRISPASVVNKSCSVNGHTGTGILINAPIAISAVNKPKSTISFVRLPPASAASPLIIFIASIVIPMNL